MSVTNKVFHVGDIGIDFKATILNDSNEAFDLTSQTAIACEFLKPDQTALSQTGAVDGTATLGKVIYTNTTNILDAPGLWKYRFKVTLSNGDIGKTTYKYFTVRA